MKCADEKEGKFQRCLDICFFICFVLTSLKKEKYRNLVTPWIVNTENKNKHKEMWRGFVTF